jgi:hypothetical protein
MAQTTEIVKVSIKDQNQNELDTGDYKGIEIDFTPPGPAEVKINLDGTSTLVTQKHKFQVTFPSQDTIMIKGANYAEPDKYTLVYNGKGNTITIEESSGSNSIEEVYVTSTSDGTGWRQLNLVSNNPSQVVILLKPSILIPPVPGGDVLWDSNIHGKWNNGQKRTVDDKEGDQSPDGKGFYTAASGNPRLIIDGDGMAHLEADAGHGRIYIKAKNYNARLEADFMFEDENIDNLSLKLRTRHQEGGDCKNRFGGFGASIDRTGTETGFKTEKCHNIHENSIDGNLPAPIQGKKWHRFAFSCYDSPDKKQVNMKMEIDYKDGQGFKTALTGKHSNPPADYIDEATFMKESYIWLRVNNEETGRVAFKDVKLIKIQPQ